MMTMTPFFFVLRNVVVVLGAKTVLKCIIAVIHAHTVKTETAVRRAVVVKRSG
jgi:hypothetical protein